MHRSHVVYSDDLTDRSRMCALRAPGAQANFESNASKILVGRANSVGGGCALRQHMGAVGDSSNLNPAGQDTREQTTKRTHTNEPADTKAHTHEGAHQHRPTNQPAPGIGFCAAKTYCIVALMVKILVVTSLSCGININFWNLQNNAPTRQKVAEDRERAAGPRARADP